MNDNNEESIKEENLEEKQEAQDVQEEENLKGEEIVPKQDYDELEDRYKRVLAEF